MLAATLLLPFASHSQNTLTFNFEDNMVPAQWSNDSVYPWTVVSDAQPGFNGTYCIKSGNGGVSSSVSEISATFTFLDEGSISFLGGCWGEGTSSVWDKCIFLIDGVQQFSYGALQTWATYTFIVTAGTHTFTWRYSKDSSVDPAGDAFFIDDIVVDLGVVSSCTRPQNLAVSNVTARTADLSWSSGTNDLALGYNILVNDDSLNLISCTDTFYTLTNLTPETQYSVKVRRVCASEYSAYTTIPVTFTTAISCPSPTGLSAVLTPGDGTVATLNWTENGTATTWEVMYGTDASLTTASTITVTGVPNCPLTGLTPETAYYAKVRAVCDVDDESSWTSIFTFTPTDDYSLTVNDGTNTNAYVPIYGYWADNHTKSQFIIPATDLASMQNGIITKLTFYCTSSSISWGNAEFAVYMAGTSDNTISALNSESSMTLVKAQGSLSVNNNIMEVVLTAPYFYAGGNLLIAFDQPTSGSYVSSNWYGVSATSGSSWGGYGSSISAQSFLPKVTFDFTPGSADICLPVSGLTVSDVLTDEATISWSGSAVSYTIYDMSDTSVVTTTTDTSYTFTNLNPMTNYMYGVMANCVSGESIIMNVSFTTACAAMTIPYTEDFEATSAALGCWSVSNIANSTGLTTNNPYSGSMAFVFGYNTNPPQYLISPELNGTDNGLSVSFMYRIQSTNYPESFQLGYSTTTNDLTAFSWGTEQTNLTNTTYLQYSEVLPAGVKYVSIKYTANDMYYLFIDSMVFEPITGNYCFPVTDLTATATSNSITLSWSDASNSGATYTVYNMTDTSVVATGLTTTSYVVNGLTPSTAYEFGVIANCSATDASNFMTISTNTDCAGGSCNIYVYAQDSYGDGWNSGTIDFLQNGISMGTYSMPTQGLSNTVIYDTVAVHVCAGTPINLTWTAGAYDSEVYMDIANANNEIVFSGQGSNLSGLFLTLDSCNATVDMILDTLTVILSVNDATMGTISPAPGTYYVSDTSSLTVVATPNTGYYFHGWTYNYNNNGTIYYDTVIDPTLTTIYIQGSYWMSVSPVNFTAIFSTQPYLGDSVLVNIAVNDPTMGTTVPAPGAHYFYEGDTCSVIAVPNTGYYLEGWYVMVTNNGDTIINQTAYTSTADVFDLFSFPIVVNSGYTTYVFNVTALFAAEPTCFVVTDLDVTATTANSITLSWIDSDNTGATYTVYDMSDSTVIATNITTTTYTVTGLTAATVYTFGVVANCSATDASNIATINATTECDVISIFPYTQNFNSIPACWNAMDVDGDGNSWEYISGAMHSASYDNYVGALTPDNWLITPHFQLAQNTSYEVTWNANPQDASWPAEHYGLYVSTTSNTDTSAFTLLQEWTLTSAGHVPVVDLSAYAGQTIYLAFRHWNCTDMFRIAIDNFELREQAGSNQITVTLTQNNPMYGGVSGGGVYTIGDNVTVTATAAQDYTFSRWADVTGATISTANPYTFVAATDITLQAIFISNTAETYDIIVDVNDSTMGYATGSGNYTAGDNAVLTAYAYEGYRFVNWTWNDMPLSTDNPFSMTVTSNSSLYPIVANFEVDTTTPEEYMTLITAVNDATMGTMTPAPGEHQYYLGDHVQFTATPNEGYHYENVHITITQYGLTFIDTVVYEDLSDLDLDVEEEMLGAVITVTVNFAPNGSSDEYVTLYTQVNDPSMGTMTPAPGEHHYYAGDNIHVSVTPYEGYRFDNAHVTVTMMGIPVLDSTISMDITDFDFEITQMMLGAVINVTVNFAPVNSIDVAGQLNDLKVYPNPTHGKVTVDADDVVKVDVMDLNGRIVTSFENTNSFDISNLATGSYVLRIETLSGVAIKRVVKK